MHRLPRELSHLKDLVKNLREFEKNCPAEDRLTERVAKFVATVNATRDLSLKELRVLVEELGENPDDAKSVARLSEKALRQVGKAVSEFRREQRNPELKPAGAQITAYDKVYFTKAIIDNLRIRIAIETNLVSLFEDASDPLITFATRARAWEHREPLAIYSKEPEVYQAFMNLAFDNKLDIFLKAANVKQVRLVVPGSHEGMMLEFAAASHEKYNVALLVEDQPIEIYCERPDSPRLINTFVKPFMKDAPKKIHKVLSYGNFRGEDVFNTCWKAYRDELDTLGHALSTQLLLGMGYRINVQNDQPHFYFQEIPQHDYRCQIVAALEHCHANEIVTVNFGSKGFDPFLAREYYRMCNTTPYGPMHKDLFEDLYPNGVKGRVQTTFKPGTFKRGAMGCPMEFHLLPKYLKAGGLNYNNSCKKWS